MKKVSTKLVHQTISIRKKDSHKGDYGRVLVIGGEENMGGAIILAASAAVHSGAGLVTVATHPSNKTALLSRLPEAMFVDYTDESALSDLISTADAVLIGPGTTENKDMLDLLSFVHSRIKDKQFFIIDGGAIGNFVKADLNVPNNQTIFTPHAMEWQSLSGIAIDEQEDELNQDKTNDIGAAIVLKGSPTITYFPQASESFENTKGTPAQATGGMGDVLAGMISAFMAQFADTPNALLSAVFVHSHIAEQLAQDYFVTLPSQIIKHIPRTMRTFQKKGHNIYV